LASSPTWTLGIGLAALRLQNGELRSLAWDLSRANRLSEALDRDSRLLQGSDGFAKRSEVLRRSSPRHKCLAGTLEPSLAEQVREGKGGVSLALARYENQRRQDLLRFLEADVDMTLGADAN
jgi:hypothetical protein